MSGFRNPFSRHSSHKKSAISKTVGREFEREVKKLEQVDEDSKKIYKDTKKYIDLQSAQMKAESKMVHNLYNSPLSRENPDLSFVSDSWLQCTQQMELKTQEVNALSQKAVVEPMKKFCTLYPNLQQLCKKRDQALSELNKCQAKVDKYSERDRSGPNIAKLEISKKAYMRAKEEFERYHVPLMRDMPRMYDKRVDYFQPSFRAHVQSQLKFYTEAQKIYSTLGSCLDVPTLPEVSNPFADEDDQARPENSIIEKTLAEIRALEITTDD